MPKIRGTNCKWILSCAGDALLASPVSYIEDRIPRGETFCSACPMTLKIKPIKFSVNLLAE